MAKGYVRDATKLISASEAPGESQNQLVKLLVAGEIKYGMD